MHPSRHARIPDVAARNLGDLTQREIRVFICLLMHRNERSGRCDPSRKTIVEFTGIRDKGNMSKAIAGLASKGWAKEGPDGFEFGPKVVAQVVELTTSEGSEGCQIDNQRLSKRQQKVVKSTTALNIILEQCSNNVFNNQSIEKIADDLARDFPEVDRRLVQIGIFQTLIRRNGSGRPITTTKYFAPEVTAIAAETKSAGLGSRAIDALLNRRREQYEGKAAA
jgi:hypothetical protein